MLPGRRTTTGNLQELATTLDTSFKSMFDPNLLSSKASTMRVHKSELGYFLKENRKIFPTSTKKSTAGSPTRKKQQVPIFHSDCLIYLPFIQDTKDSILGSSVGPTSYSRDLRSSYAGRQWSPSKGEDRALLQEKDRTIDNLALNLKQKMGDVLRLEETNRELRDKLQRLESTAKQSESLAHEEYQNVVAELEKTNEGKQQLETEIQKLQEFMEELKGKTTELQVQNTELIQEAYKVRDYD